MSTTRKSEFDGHEISRLVTNNLEQRSPSFALCYYNDKSIRNIPSIINSCCEERIASSKIELTRITTRITFMNHVRWETKRERESWRRVYFKREKEKV